jgi:excisionase family DNA binding protein
MTKSAELSSPSEVVKPHWSEYDDIGRRMTSPLLTAHEAARYLRMATSTFYANVLPHIPQVRPTPGRVLFHKDDLDEYIERTRQPKIGDPP